jgi:hypothetical protein
MPCKFRLLGNIALLSAVTLVPVFLRASDSSGTINIQELLLAHPSWTLTTRGPNTVGMVTMRFALRDKKLMASQFWGDMPSCEGPVELHSDGFSRSGCMSQAVIRLRLNPLKAATTFEGRRTAPQGEYEYELAPSK